MINVQNIISYGGNFPEHELTGHRRQIIESKRSKYADGVFVDASVRDGVAYIGIVKVENYQIIKSQTFKCEIQKNTHFAEITAVVKAIRLYPNSVIFTDCDAAYQATEDDKVFLIQRGDNLAHCTSRRINNAEKM